MEIASAACSPCAHPCHASAENSPLMRHGEAFRFKRGEVLWRQGDPADALISMCVGVLKISRTFPGGRSAVVGLAHRGDLIGINAAVPGARAPLEVVGLVAGRAMRLPAERLQAILKEKPELAATLLERSCVMASDLAERLDEMGHGPVESRLARVLLRLSKEAGMPDQRGVFVPIRFSRGDLADMVGCRVETTIRVMTRWQRDGVVETKREGLVIHDTALLAEAAEAAA